MLRKVLWTLAIGATLLLALAVPEIINRKAQLAATERQLASADPIIGNFAPAPIVYKPDVFGSAPKPAPAPTATVQSQAAPVPINRVQIGQDRACALWRESITDIVVTPGVPVIYKSEPPNGCLGIGIEVFVTGGECPKNHLRVITLKSRGNPNAAVFADRQDQFNTGCKCKPGTVFTPPTAAIRDGTPEARAAHEWCQAIPDKK